MNDAIDDCLIADFEPLINSLSLPDMDDRHILAAAIVGHADAIVTYNSKDFPDSDVRPFNIEILHQDDFLVAQYDLDPVRMLTVIKSIRERLRKPPKTARELVDMYAAQRLPQIVRIFDEAIELL